MPPKNRENPLPVVYIVTTGGTIASRIDPATGAAVPAVTADELVSEVPELKRYAAIRSREFSLFSSWNMTPARAAELAGSLSKILAKDEVSGVVVTHGTDTMEETAFALDLLLDTEKAVVCTGAMRSAGQSGADGPANLLSAVRLAAVKEGHGLGVTIVMNDRIHAARYATKMHTTAVDAFQSPDTGLIGSIDHGGVWLRSRLRPTPKLPGAKPSENVYLIKMASGMGDLLLRAMLESRARGVVIEGSGAGNVYEGWEDSISELLKRGVPVVLVSRCAAGRIVAAYGGAGGGRTLHDLGIIDGGALSGQKARIALMFGLGSGLDPEGLRRFFAELTV